MTNLKQRLAKLERMFSTTDDNFSGVVEVPPGTRPIDALQGSGPGLWFLIDAACNGPGFIGRVSSRGKCEILFGDETHEIDTAQTSQA